MPQQTDIELDALTISQLGRSIDRIIEAERARAASHHADETEHLRAAHEAELSALSHRLEIALQDIACLQQDSVVQRDRHTEALRAAHEQTSIAEAGREWANAQVAAVEKARLSLVRETGHLEGQLAAHLKAHAARFAAAERQRAELAEERDALIGQGTALSAERDHLIGQLKAARQEAAQQLTAVEHELATLRDHIAWRERQLLQAATLLATMPDPLSGLPRRRAALVRRFLGESGLAAIADHRAAVARWQGDIAGQCIASHPAG